MYANSRPRTATTFVSKRSLIILLKRSRIYTIVCLSRQDGTLRLSQCLSDLCDSVVESSRAKVHHRDTGSLRHRGSTCFQVVLSLRCPYPNRLPAASFFQPGMTVTWKPAGLET